MNNQEYEKENSTKRMQGDLYGREDRTDKSYYRQRRRGNDNACVQQTILHVRYPEHRFGNNNYSTERKNYTTNYRTRATTIFRYHHAK